LDEKFYVIIEGSNVLKFLRQPGYPSLLLAFFILLATGVLSTNSWNRQLETRNSARGTRHVLDATAAYFSAMQDAETGQRGYLLTRKSRYMKPYLQSIQVIPTYLATLEQLTSGEQKQHDHVAQLASVSDQKLKELQRTLALSEAGSLNEALALVGTDRGLSLMNTIRTLVSEIHDEQYTQLAARAAEADRLGQETVWGTIVGSTLLLFLLLSATLAANRARVQQARALLGQKESEGRFVATADSAPVMIWMAGLDKKCFYFNKAWLAFTGRTPAQELEDGWTEGIHSEDKDRYRATYADAFDARHSFRIEYRLRRHDGRYRWILDNGTPRHLQAGEFVGYIGSCLDIHDMKEIETELERRIEARTEELKHKEAELHQSRKIEAIGRLAGGVAHDFNNLLTGILGIAEEVRERQTEQDLKEEMDELMKAAQRASALTKQLLAFGRRQIAAPEVLNLNTSINGMMTMLKRLIGEDTRLQTVLAPDLGFVQIDPGQVEQIVINLTLNARDAMPQGGRITIETANVMLDKEYAKRHFEIVPGPHILLAISDTGGGIDPATQEHVFEPFFSTKEMGKGSGMGLATVYGIVKQNNGDIFIYSTPGAGTTFKIYLPRTNIAPAPAKLLETPSLRGTETVLIVEDEEIVRRVAVKALQRNGYKVLEASHGKEALEIVASYGKPIDLLLTDVIMPGMNGRQLAELLSHQLPDMKILYTSGYTENIIVQRGLLKPGIAFIEKSFTSEMLCRKIRQILDLQAV
jgi:PAS domain S-box-containing protein